MISNEQYAEIQQQLLALAVVVNEMDLDGFLERICHRLKRLARATKGLQEEVHRQTELGFVEFTKKWDE